ncbi:hypothetical protein SDC9_71262 [bioreactor metagenome]|uniref:Rubrerythrin diiron-binding domain-containing protein n=1 Tax=bioreactor metagenome TaxID=1076179 RepID=A0A644Y9D0_9ZZZZ
MTPFTSSQHVFEHAMQLEDQMVRIFEFCCQKEYCQQFSGLFARFADEEKLHKQRLGNIMRSTQAAFDPALVADISPENYAELPDPCQAPDMAAALQMAMEVEKNAYRFYSDLSLRMSDPLLASLFDMLAQEESQHKLRFELELDRIRK